MGMATVNSSVLQRVSLVDARALRWMLRRKTFAKLALLGRLISKTADGYFYPLLALTLFYADDPMAPKYGLALVVALAVERIAYQLLKKGFKRNRPSDCLPDIRGMVIPGDQFSFPSGHTSAAFLVASVLAAYFSGISLLVYGWAALVGWSRVCLGVHFPSDTVAGATLGFSCAQIAMLVML